MMLDATTTNVISNLINAAVIFVLFLLSAWRYFKKDQGFDTVFLPALFFAFLLVKLLAALVHYSALQHLSGYLWPAVSLSFVLVSYATLSLLDISNELKFLFMLLVLVLAGLFITTGYNFIWIALTSLMIYITAAINTRGWVRIGFIGVVLSNLIWIGLRHATEAYLGHPVPVEYRYDNDVYHILIIVSCYWVYKGTAQGGWRKA